MGSLIAANARKNPNEINLMYSFLLTRALIKYALVPAPLPAPGEREMSNEWTDGRKALCVISDVKEFNLCLLQLLEPLRARRGASFN
jgi:hypothetical protein